MYFVTYPNAWIIELLAILIVVIGATYLSYRTMKSAIRDGIDESKLRLDQPRQQMAPMGYKWVLVKDDKPNPDDLRIH